MDQIAYIQRGYTTDQVSTLTGRKPGYGVPILYRGQQYLEYIAALIDFKDGPL